MAKMNYNRPIFKQIDDRNKTQLQVAKKPLGNTSVIMNGTLKFGKYKDWHIRDIPTNYLEWLVSVTEDDSTALRYCKELANRPKYK